MDSFVFLLLFDLKRLPPRERLFQNVFFWSLFLSCVFLEQEEHGNKSLGTSASPSDKRNRLYQPVTGILEMSNVRTWKSFGATFFVAFHIVPICIATLSDPTYNPATFSSLRHLSYPCSHMVHFLEISHPSQHISPPCFLVVIFPEPLHPINT